MADEVGARGPWVRTVLGARLSIELDKTKARLYGRAAECRPAVSSAWKPVVERRWPSLEIAGERGCLVGGVAGEAVQLSVVSSVVVVLLQFNLKVATIHFG